MVSPHVESPPGRGAMETEGAPGVCPQRPGRTAAAALIVTAERGLQGGLITKMSDGPVV